MPRSLMEGKRGATARRGEEEERKREGEGEGEEESGGVRIRGEWGARKARSREWQHQYGPGGWVGEGGRREGMERREKMERRRRQRKCGNNEKVK